jgi:hypothetical protein
MVEVPGEIDVTQGPSTLEDLSIDRAKRGIVPRPGSFGQSA